MATSATTKFTINAATFMSPGDLTKAQHMVEREAGKSGEMLMRTAAQSITSGIRKWASANTASFQSDIDKALQPFLNSLEKQVVRSLGGARVSTLPHTIRATGGTPASQTVVGGLVAPGVVDPNIFNMLTVKQQQNIAYQAQIQQLKQSTISAAASAKMTTSSGGGGGERGGAVGESISMALTMETIHAMVEQIGEVRNEMYDANIQASNLQRQMLIPIAPGNDIRNFTNAIADPGMALGYTKQQALAAASTLALASNSKTTEETVTANEAMFKFANRFGLEAPQWANMLAGGETAGLFGQGPGNLGYGGKGVEAYQARLSGLYSIASQPNGTPGNRGTGLQIDEFAESINSLSQALGDATGNSEDAAKAFTNLGDKGNVFNMYTALQRTGNQAFSGQAGVNLLMGVHSSIQNQVFGSPMQQAVAYATHPGMTMGQIFHAENQGLTNPNEFRNQMKFINANYKGDDRELALHQLFGLSYGAGAQLEQIYGKNAGKGATEEQLKAASSIIGYGEDSQAKVYRTAMDALTKSMEELAQFISPVVVGFDNLQGATHGLAGIILMTVGALKGKKLLERLLGGGEEEGHHTKGLLGDIKELAKGKGQPVYVTNEFLRVVGNMGGGNVQNFGKGLMGEAEAVGEEALPGALPETAVAMGGVGELAGAGIGAEGLGLTGLSLGGLASGAGGLLATLVAPEVMIPLAAAVATGYAVTHPKQVGSFLGGAAKFAGNALFQASGIPEVASLAQAGWKGASGLTSFLLGSKTAGAIGTEIGHDLTDPFGITSALFGKHGKGGLRGDLFGTNRHVGGALGNLASAWIGDPLKNAWQTVTGAPGRWLGAMNKIGQGEGILSKVGKEGILGAIGDTFLDTFSLETDKHKKKTETARFAHLIAANKMIENLLGKHLDPNAPLGPQLVSDITSGFTSLLKGIWDGASKFFKGFVKNLGDLWTHLFGSKPPGHPAPSHGPAPHAGAVASTSPTSGSSTVTLAPIKLHITVQGANGHTTTHVMDHHPLKHVATPHKITIGPQHHTQPKR